MIRFLHHTRELAGRNLWSDRKPDLDTQTHQPNFAEPKAFDRWLNSIRERIEGVFHEIRNTGRNIERLLAKTIHRLCTRVITKMASHALMYFLWVAYGIKVQTFEIVTAKN